jgi:hypothetical protein
MQITIDLMQLLTALLVIAGIAVCVALFVALVRLIAMLKRSEGLVKDATLVMASASKSVPPILKDAEAICSSTRSGVEAIGGAAQSVGEGVSSLFGSDEESAAGTVETVFGIVDRVLAIIGLFTGGRKKRHKKR